MEELNYVKVLFLSVGIMISTSRSVQCPHCWENCISLFLKEGADLKGAAPELQDDPHFYLHMCRDWKSNISNRDGRDDFASAFLIGWEASSSRKDWAQSRSSSSQMSQMRWHGHLFRMPPRNPGHARGTKYISTGLQTPWGSPGEERWTGQEKRSLGLSV